MSEASTLAWTKPTADGPVPAAFRVSVSACCEPKTTRSSVPEPPPESTMSTPVVLPGHDRDDVVLAAACRARRWRSSCWCCCRARRSPLNGVTVRRDAADRDLTVERVHDHRVVAVAAGELDRREDAGDVLDRRTGRPLLAVARLAEHAVTRAWVLVVQHVARHIVFGGVVARVDRVRLGPGVVQCLTGDERVAVEAHVGVLGFDQRVGRRRVLALEHVEAEAARHHVGAGAAVDHVVERRADQADRCRFRPVRSGRSGRPGWRSAPTGRAASRAGWRRSCRLPASPLIVSVSPREREVSRIVTRRLQLVSPVMVRLTSIPELGSSR